MRRDWRRQRLPAGLPGRHAGLETRQGSGVSHCKNHVDGVLLFAGSALFSAVVGPVPR